MREKKVWKAFPAFWDRIDARLKQKEIVEASNLKRCWRYLNPLTEPKLES